MLKCRMLEKQALTQRNGFIGPHAAMSQEAAAAGVGVDLLPEDTLAPSHQGLIQCFVKGLPVNRIFSKPGARSPFAPLNLISPKFSLSVQLDRVIAAAIANKKCRNKKIAVAFCGHVSASPSLLHETIRIAGKRNLPMLLICHNDTDEDICQQAEASGFPGVTVDGDDAVAVYRVATEAIAHARRGSGPTLIECRPWPLATLKSGKRSKPIDRIFNMETYLVRKSLFDKKFKSAVIAAFRRELDAAIKI
jgi:pyruvate dehydrogenase E1 component alpha subunit